MRRHTHEFIRIHPCDDGNGRVVRLLVNYLLLRVGLLPLVVKSRDRRRYLEVIAFADTGDLAPLAEFMAEALRWSLRLGLEAASRLVELESGGE
ncbi:MAG: Fic family protein [Sulfuritalea sp.]|nr:Fic family protein [Sulfuritalea sp.]